MKHKKEFDRLVDSISNFYYFNLSDPVYDPDGFHEITFSIQRSPVDFFGRVMFDDLGSITLILDEKNLLQESKSSSYYKVDEVVECLSELNDDLHKFFQAVSGIRDVFE